MSDRPRLLLAEDEPLLARAFARLLAATWPEAQLLATADDGPAAIALAMAERPDVLFLDVRMPGCTGLEAAEAIVDDWPGDDGRPPPLLVFVTAFEEFAVAAFEQAAIDYLLKPVTPERLQRAVERLRERLASRRAADAGEPAALLRRVQSIDGDGDGGLPAARGGGMATAGAGPVPAATADAGPLRILRAGQGATVKMIRVADVIAFEAVDKYVNVVTADGEALIRISLRELAARIDDPDFLQVHRSLLVNQRAIDCATRDELGHYHLTLRGLARTLKVSRAFSHLFRPM